MKLKTTYKEYVNEMYNDYNVSDKLTLYHGSDNEFKLADIKKNIGLYGIYIYIYNNINRCC
jgi:hypothetical protein